MKWRTRDWKIIDIKDMSDEHLKNAIKYIEKRAENWIEQPYWCCADIDSFSVDVIFWEEAKEALWYFELLEEQKEREFYRKKLISTHLEKHNLLCENENVNHIIKDFLFNNTKIEKWNENVEICSYCGIKWKKIGKQCPVCYSNNINPNK